MNMPKINVENLGLTGDDLLIVRRIVNSRTGELRASKPPCDKQIVRYEIVDLSQYQYARPDEHYHRPIYDYADHDGEIAGMAAYVWRHVAFLVSPKPAHQCMPCLAECDLPDCITKDEYMMSNPGIKHLHDLVDVVVDSIRPDQWHGVRRWGQAFGLIGTPRYDKDGAVIYR